MSQKILNIIVWRQQVLIKAFTVWVSGKSIRFNYHHKYRRAETIEKEPQELGYEFGRWTAQRLATYLENITGIKLSGSQVRRILEQKKYVYIWAKYSLDDKKDPEKRKAFKQKITEYLRMEKERPDLIQVWFWAQSRRTEYSARRTCATRVDLV